MIDFECIIQEGIVGPELRPRLISSLASVCSSVLGEPADSVRVSFTEVPEGSGYQGGEPSRISLIMGRIPPGSESRMRTQLLKDIGDMWSQQTGCPADQIVVAATDRTD